MTALINLTIMLTLVNLIVIPFALFVFFVDLD